MVMFTPPLAEPDADSIQSNRGNDVVVDVHGSRDLPEESRDEEASKLSDPSFILDSGASHHATSDKWLLLVLLFIVAWTYQCPLTPPPVITGSVVRKKFQLPDVRYAPDLPPGTVLVSVRQLAALGYLIMFGGGRCIVRSGSSGKVVGEGRLGDDGLYRLDYLNIPLNKAAAAGADSTV